MRQLYEAVLACARECGPLKVIPQKSRIALQVRMRFAAFMPLRSSLKGHLVLAERHPARCFERIDTYSPRNHVHVFRLGSLAELTPEFASFLRAAYQVGRQEHRVAAPGQGTKAQRGSEARGSSGATRQAGRRAG